MTFVSPALVASPLIAVRRHVGRADDLLQLEAVLHRLVAVDAHDDRPDAEPDQDDGCDEAADLQDLPHDLAPSLAAGPLVVQSAFTPRTLRAAGKHGISASPPGVAGLPHAAARQAAGLPCSATAAPTAVRASVCSEKATGSGRSPETDSCSRQRTPIVRTGQPGYEH